MKFVPKKWILFKKIEYRNLGRSGKLSGSKSRASKIQRSQVQFPIGSDKFCTCKISSFTCKIYSVWSRIEPSIFGAPEIDPGDLPLRQAPGFF